MFFPSTASEGLSVISLVDWTYELTLPNRLRIWNFLWIVVFMCLYKISSNRIQWYKARALFPLCQCCRSTGDAIGLKILKRNFWLFFFFSVNLIWCLFQIAKIKNAHSNWLPPLGLQQSMWITVKSLCPRILSARNLYRLGLQPAL